MSVANYKRSLGLVLAHEGGFVNHPKDPGGPTNKGVTQRVYDDYRKVHGASIQSVKFITDLETSEIYRKQYWCLVHADDLPAGLDYAVFDFAVNSGLSRSIRYLQRTIGVKDDAIIGNGTLAAIYAAERSRGIGLIGDFCNNRMAFLKSLSTFPTFGKGWTRRVCGSVLGAQVNDNGVIDLAYVMAQAEATPQVGTVVGELPAPIGHNSGEVPAKAFSDDYDTWPMAEKNDYLARLIEAS